MRCQELMKQDTQDGIKLVGANVDYMQVFVTVNSVGIKIIADVNLKNVIKDLFGILATVNVNVINHGQGEYLDYENCKCRKKQLINQLKNLVKMLMTVK